MKGMACAAQMGAGCRPPAPQKAHLSLLPVDTKGQRHHHGELERPTNPSPHSRHDLRLCITKNFVEGEGKVIPDDNRNLLDSVLRHVPS